MKRKQDEVDLTDKLKKLKFESISQSSLNALTTEHFSHSIPQPNTLKTHIPSKPYSNISECTNSSFKRVSISTRTASSAGYIINEELKMAHLSSRMYVENAEAFKTSIHSLDDQCSYSEINQILQKLHFLKKKKE